MPTNTYTVIQSYTFPSAAATVTLNTLPTTYTNLKLVVVLPSVAATAGRTALRFNGDTASNYHYAQFGSSNTSTTADQSDSVNYCMIGYNNGTHALTITDIPGYRTTNFNKTIYSFIGSPYPEVGNICSTWRNTAAITSIQVYGLGTFPAGTNVTLYGLVG